MDNQRQARYFQTAASHMYVDLKSRINVQCNVLKGDPKGQWEIDEATCTLFPDHKPILLNLNSHLETSHQVI